MALLVTVPALLLCIPAAAGHPAVGGDNLIQNFPLRVLAGRQLSEGHLPLWNPYIWSGSPLLGGLNAGALYPLTLLFAVAPPLVAWMANLVAVYWAGGIGLYVLARQYRLRPTACLLAALVYSLGGTMSGQLVHLGVVQGIAWMPWLVLAEIRLSWAVLGTGPALAETGAAVAGIPSRARPAHWRAGSPWPWAALLAACVGLEGLTGEPRAMAGTEVVAAAVAAWLLFRPYAGGIGIRHRLRFAGWAVAAGAWGTALAAAELAPGWSFIRASQRSAESYAFFGAGSLRPSWSSLLFVPDLFGGTGIWGQPEYFNHYSLAEVTGYAGILALVAAVVLLTRSFGRRRSALAADWGLWLALAVLGLLLAWGGFTPLGHLWASIPLFGRTRLQSRSLAIVDLGLAMALAFWADRVLAIGGRGLGTGAHHPGPEHDAGWAGWRRAAATVPPGASALLCVLAMAFPVGTEEWFGATALGGAAARGLRPWLAVQLLLAVGVGWAVWRGSRLRPRRRRWALVGLVVADLALFVVATSTAVAPAPVTLQPSAALAQRVLGHAGRFAIYDTTAAHIVTLAPIGQPDLNALTRLSSVQGYGSILSQPYGAATGSHTLDNLTPCALARGVFVPLRLATVLALSQFLAPEVSASGRVPPPVACPGAPLPGTPTERTFYIGQVVEVRTATLVAGTATGTAAASTRAHLSSAQGQAAPTPAMRVGILTATGRTVFPRASVRWTGRGWAVRFARPQPAVGIVVRGDARAVLDSSTVAGTVPRAAAPGRWVFDGPLQDALSVPGRWRYAGLWRGYMKVTATSVRPPVWVAGVASSCRSGRCAPAPATVRQIRVSDWGTEVDSVDARRAVTVVRSEAYLEGWSAELAPAGGGPVRRLVVHRRGLVQAVRVPAGRWTLTFVYRAPHLTVGMAASGAAAAGFVSLGAGAFARRRHRHRHRRGRPPARPPAAGRAATAPGVHPPLGSVAR